MCVNIASMLFEVPSGDLWMILLSPLFGGLFGMLF